MIFFFMRHIIWVIYGMFAVHALAYNFFSGHIQALTLLFLLTAGMTTFYSLWLYNTFWHIEDLNHKRGHQDLTQTLLSDRHNHMRVRWGGQILQGQNKVLCVFAVLLIIYIFWVALNAAFPLYPARYYIWRQSVLQALSHLGVSDIFLYTRIYDALRNAICILTVGAFFFLTRHILARTEKRLWHCTGLQLLFAGLMMQYFFANGMVFRADMLLMDWRGGGAGFAAHADQLGIVPALLSSYNVRLIELGYGGVILLYAIGALSTLLMLRHIFTAAPKILAVWGVLSLGAIGAIDMYFVADTALMPVFIAGWMSISAWLVYLDPPRRKTYTIRQM